MDPIWKYHHHNKYSFDNNNLKMIYYEWGFSTNLTKHTPSGLMLHNRLFLIGHGFIVLKRSLKSWIFLKNMVVITNTCSKEIPLRGSTLSGVFTPNLRGIHQEGQYYPTTILILSFLSESGIKYFLTMCLSHQNFLHGTREPYNR